MSIYKNVLNSAKINKKLRLEGKDTCIPFILIPELGTVIPGIEQEKYYIVTANSKVGKTKLADFLFLYNPYEYTLAKTSNIKVKIFYFSLEVSKEEKIRQYLSYRLFKDHKICISPEKIMSKFQKYVLDDKIEEFLESYDEHMNNFESKVTIIDNIRNPFGIFKYMRDYAYSHGKYYSKTGDSIDPHDFNSPIETVRKKALETVDRYVPDDPDEYVIVITDHLSLLQPENGNDLWSAIFKFSSDYCLAMRDRWRYSVINIQQQAADQEKQQFTFKGESIVAKLRPSPDGLADCKLTQRDCNIMLGLFAPHRYKIDDYEDYDIQKLGDNYREMSILLNRSGSGGLNLDLYFNGASNFFAKLPNPDNMEKMYKHIIEINERTI